MALANTLPGPIATKMAGYIGYRIRGIAGMLNAIAATVVPTCLLMVVFLGLIYKYKDSPNVKKMTQLIRPAIAVLLGVMTFDFFFNSYGNIGMYSTIFLVVISFLLLERWKVHPAFVIVGALFYGALFLGGK